MNKGFTGIYFSYSLILFVLLVSSCVHLCLCDLWLLCLRCLFTQYTQFKWFHWFCVWTCGTFYTSISYMRYMSIHVIHVIHILKDIGRWIISVLGCCIHDTLQLLDGFSLCSPGFNRFACCGMKDEGSGGTLESLKFCEFCIISTMTIAVAAVASRRLLSNCELLTLNHFKCFTCFKYC